MREQVDCLMKQALKLLVELEVMWDNAVGKITNQQGENK